MSLLYGYDPPLDLSVELRCVTPGCVQDVTWHPETRSASLAGWEPITFYVAGAFRCAECGHEGAEV